MENNITKFILNNEEIDTVIKESYKTISLHKEKIDDRFTIIYGKNYSDNLEQERYDVVGILDIDEKCLYNPSYIFNDMIPKDSLLKTSSYSNLEMEINSKINNEVKKVVLENPTEYMEYGKEKFSFQTNKDRENILKKACKLFVRNDNPKDDLDMVFNKWELFQIINYNKGQSLMKYLYSKDEYIKNATLKYIDSKKEDIGLALINMREEKRVLEDIIKNKDGKYESININKRILDSIKDVYASRITVTIEYGGKEISFKTDYMKMKEALLNCESGSCDSGNSYRVVSDFIKENGKNEKYDRYLNDFEFSHIKKITYGKDTLYVKEEPKTIKKQKNKDMER